MKKTHKLLLLFLSILFVFVLFFMSTFKIAKTQEDIINDLQQELHLSTENTCISYAGNFVINEKALLWFSIQKAYDTDYRAVECRLLKNGKYILKSIHKPMTYAQNIVHIVWMNKDIFLICDSNCQSIVYKNQFDDIIAKIDLSTNNIPYVFLDTQPDNAVKLDFLDAEGNSIR